MKNMTINVILAAFLLITANSKADTEQKDLALKIYLPREITIESDVPNLGQVAIIRGEESLATKAGKVTLGRIPTPGQKIIVDRSIVLSRLASSGIPSSEVTLTGAEKTTITQQHQTIKASNFIETALSFVTKNPPEGSVCEFNPIRIPKDLVFPGVSRSIKLLPCSIKNVGKNQVRVRVAAFSDDKEVGMREVTFRLKYHCRRVIATSDIPPGEIISSENVKIEKAVSNYPEPDWKIPYGFVALRRLSANSIIRPNMIGLPKPPVLLKRGQNVIIKIDKFGLLVTAIGKAIQEGKIGEYIKVQNVDSQRIIRAKVNEDGSVEPVY